MPIADITGGNYSNGAYSSNGQSRLSVDDQREFDKYYSKWLEDMRKNHRDDIDKDVRHMQDIMGRLQHTRQHPFRSNRIPGCSTTLTSDEKTGGAGMPAPPLHRPDVVSNREPTNFTWLRIDQDRPLPTFGLP
jgi:hypothetical protein